MHTTHRFRRARTACLIAAALLAGCAGLRQQPGPPPSAAADATALTLTAEAALKRGDCRAAAGADARLARRATEVAVACEHLPAAWGAVSRWRTLAPSDRDANALYAL